MSAEEKKRLFRYQHLLKMTEPFEMTYWKKRLQSPYWKFISWLKGHHFPINKPSAQG